MSDRASRGTLRDALRVLREQRWTILLVTLGFVGVATLFDGRAKKIYAPAAGVEVGPLAPDAPVLGIRTLVPDVPPASVTSRVAQVVRRREVLDDARRRLGSAVPPDYSLANRTSPSASGAGRVYVVVRDEDAERGARAANAVAASVVARINADELARLDRVIAALLRERRQLAGARRIDLGAQIRRGELRAQAASLEVVRDVAEPAKIVRPAFPPEKPSFSPGERVRPALYLGLSLSLLSAFLLDALARRPREPARLAEAAGLPLVGQIPRLDKDDDTEVRLAYEHLLTAVEHLGAGAPSRIVLVTSPGPGEGKSTVSLALVAAAAAAGRRACLVECDLRRPVLAARLGIGGPGLTELLAGRAEAADVLMEAPEGLYAERVGVIAAGGPAKQPAEALSSPKLRELLTSMAESHDLVVVDAAPVLVASDALALVPQADAVLLCARAGRTTSDELDAARQALERLPERPSGLIVTAVAARVPTIAFRPGYDPSPGAA